MWLQMLTCTCSLILLMSKGWRSSESARLPLMWPRFKSPRRRHMWVKFVFGSLLCSERFFSGDSSFPLSSKTNISKFQLDQESGRWRTTLWMCYLQIIITIINFIAERCWASCFRWGRKVTNAFRGLCFSFIQKSFMAS